MIFNISACKFDPKALACKGAKADGCLSMEQAARSRRHLPARRIRRGARSIPASSTTPASRSTQGIPGLLHGGQPVGRRARRSGWTSTLRASGRWRIPPRPEHDVTLDQPEHVLEPRRQADLLARRQRPVVLGARHGRLLRADDEGQRRARAGEELEPAVHGPRAWGIAAAARRSTPSMRSPHRGLGREGHRASEPDRDRARVPRPQPAAVRVPAARALQGQRQHGGRANFECRP